VAAIAAVVACSGSDDGSPPPASGDGGVVPSGDAGGTHVACKKDADCVATLPQTTPPGCATATCDLVQGQCAYVAKDADGDGHRSASCKAPSGPTIQAGDDCDDADAQLYPGHPEDCSVLPDGTTATWPTGSPAGACQYGKISCQMDGTKSACTGTVGPKARNCTSPQDNDCDGKPDQSECVCLPGATQCATGDAGMNGVQTCTPEGQWGPASPCVASTCQSSADAGGGASCQGACSPGQTNCSGNGLQQCVNGTWGTPTACVNSACVVSAPGKAACTGVCSPGQTECKGNSLATCSSSGQYDNGTPCANTTCSGPVGSASCGGVCAPGQTRCAGNTYQSCQNGQWGGDVDCAGQNQTCITSGGGSSCQGVCAPGQTTCANLSQRQGCQNGQWVDDVNCASQHQTCYQNVCSGVCAPGQSYPSNQCANFGSGCALTGTAGCDGTGQYSGPHCDYACTSFAGSAPNPASAGCSNLCSGASCTSNQNGFPQFVSSCPAGSQKVACSAYCVNGCCANGFNGAGCSYYTFWINPGSPTDATCGVHIGTSGCNGMTVGVSTTCQPLPQ
jgi:hypothetical protein